MTKKWIFSKGKFTSFIFSTSFFFPLRIVPQKLAFFSRYLEKKRGTSVIKKKLYPLPEMVNFPSPTVIFFWCLKFTSVLFSLFKRCGQAVAGWQGRVGDPPPAPRLRVDPACLFQHSERRVCFNTNFHAAFFCVVRDAVVCLFFVLAKNLTKQKHWAVGTMTCFQNLIWLNLFFIHVSTGPWNLPVTWRCKYPRSTIFFMVEFNPKIAFF